MAQKTKNTTQPEGIRFFDNSRREWFLIGTLVGVVLAVAAYGVAHLLA